MPSTALDGKRILVIVLIRDDASGAYLVEGLGRAEGDELEVVPASGQGLRIGARDLLYNTFDPAVLPSLVGEDRHVRLAAQLAREVDRCIVIFSDRPPEGQERLRDFIGGLATGPNGEIYFTQVR
jgi:hypothetical protein